MKRLVIVTGSSRGIGASIAAAFSQTFPANTHVVLMARNLEKMNQVKLEILSKQPANQVTALQADFGRVTETNEYFKIIKSIAKSDEEIKSYDELYAIYNHGTLEFGPTTLYAQGNLREAYEVNLFSVWSLLAAINLWAPVETIPKQFHVNISSRYALNAYANSSGHCTIRASREMLFKCLALDQPKFRVLNYFPGTVLTDMFMQSVEQGVKRYQEMLEEKKYVLADDTARNLVNILGEDKFVSGSHIGFNDL